MKNNTKKETESVEEEPSYLDKNYDSILDDDSHLGE